MFFFFKQTQRIQIKFNKKIQREKLRILVWNLGGPHLNSSLNAHETEIKLIIGDES